MGAQITLLVLSLLGLGIALGKHGEAKPSTRYSFGESLFNTALIFLILWWGGFWDVLFI